MKRSHHKVVGGQLPLRVIAPITAEKALKKISKIAKDQVPRISNITLDGENTFVNRKSGPLAPSIISQNTYIPGLLAKGIGDSEAQKIVQKPHAKRQTLTLSSEPNRKIVVPNIVRTINPQTKLDLAPLIQYQLANNELGTLFGVNDLLAQGNEAGARILSERANREYSLTAPQVRDRNITNKQKAKTDFIQRAVIANPDLAIELYANMTNYSIDEQQDIRQALDPIIKLLPRLLKNTPGNPITKQIGRTIETQTNPEQILLKKIQPDEIENLDFSDTFKISRPRTQSVPDINAPPYEEPNQSKDYYKEIIRKGAIPFYNEIVSDVSIFNNKDIVRKVFTDINIPETHDIRDFAINIVNNESTLPELKRKIKSVKRKIVRRDEKKSQSTPSSSISTSSSSSKKRFTLKKKQSNTSSGSGISGSHDTDFDHAANRVEVILGSIMNGNDSPALKNTLSSLLDYLYFNKQIDKQSVKEILKKVFR
jgi:hypothetical protein